MGSQWSVNCHATVLTSPKEVAASLWRKREENPVSIPLETIEVQAGAYLKKDDFVRFEDHHGRA
jgi:hypothetical protein